jgi:pimeloyl-ACP methyl ester carboxylesterase
VKRVALAASAFFVMTASAFADPVLDRVTSVVSKGRRLDVTIESTLAAPGEVAVEGTVNGNAFSLRKKAKAGSRTVTLKVDAKKLRLRALTTNLEFDVDVVAREKGGAEVRQRVTATVPVPCIVLPGFGNESTPGAFDAFALALNVAAGGAYTTDGEHPTLVVHEYPSLTESLSTLGKGVAKPVAAALKGTIFAKVDVVGYSYGGVVARSFMAQGGGSRVRRCVFMATPNLGCPIAYAAVGLSNSGQLDQLLATNPALAGIAEQLLSPDAKESLRNLYPTYAWVTPAGPFTTILLSTLLGDPSTPLTALNAVAPPAGATFDAFFYTSTGAGELGTVDVVSLSALQGGGQIDPAAIATGSGDGVVPAHSVTMNEVAAWRSVITPHDMGVGTHLTIAADLNVIAGVAAVLTQ